MGHFGWHCDCVCYEDVRWKWREINNVALGSHRSVGGNVVVPWQVYSRARRHACVQPPAQGDVSLWGDLNFGAEGFGGRRSNLVGHAARASFEVNLRGVCWGFRLRRIICSYAWFEVRVQFERLWKHLALQYNWISNWLVIVRNSESRSLAIYNFTHIEYTPA